MRHSPSQSIQYNSRLTVVNQLRRVERQSTGGGARNPVPRVILRSTMNHVNPWLAFPIGYDTLMPMNWKRDMPHEFVIRGGRVIDPANGIDRQDDLHVVNHHVQRIGGPTVSGRPVVDAAGLIVCPGLIDMHVHLREPGGEHKETIETGTRAAAAGGFTAVACMPNTRPALDEPQRIRDVRECADRVGHCRVYPIAAMTQGRRGSECVDFAALRTAGAVAFSDDGDGVENDDVMQTIFGQAASMGFLVIQHCEFKPISAGGVMHRGIVSEQLGLPGIDPRAEEAMIERDIELARRAGARYHVAHISTARAVELVRAAKKDGLPVTTEVCPHHLLLTDHACRDCDPNTKMHPPLRTSADVRACVDGVIDGTIDCLVTDHAPHSAVEKAVGFQNAPFGIVGLETSLGLAAQALLHGGGLNWPELIDRMSAAPASLLGVPGGHLTPGTPADITLIDPEMAWRVDVQQFRSTSRNSPFDGWELNGRAVATWVAGSATFLHESMATRCK